MGGCRVGVEVEEAEEGGQWAEGREEELGEGHDKEEGQVVVVEVGGRRGALKGGGEGVCQGRDK